MVKKIFLASALLLCTAVWAFAQQFADPCQSNAKISVPISQATSTTLFSGASARKNYVCSVAVVSPDAEKLALIEGTGTVCATASLGLIGPTTVASGLSLAANGVLALGSGTATVAAGANTNFNVCLLQSGTGFIGGVMTYVQQ